jgi:hypothetical protein
MDMWHVEQSHTGFELGKTPKIGFSISVQKLLSTF